MRSRFIHEGQEFEPVVSFEDLDEIHDLLFEPKRSENAKQRGRARADLVEKIMKASGIDWRPPGPREATDALWALYVWAVRVRIELDPLEPSEM